MIEFILAALVAAAGPTQAEPAVPATPPVDVVPPVRIRVIPATPVPATTVAEPLICKSTLQTGSLIARRKQCLTKAQWRYVDDVQRKQTQDLFDEQRTRQGCTDAATC